MIRLIGRLFGRRPDDQEARAITHESWGIPISMPNDTGVPVSESNALTASAVWACVQVIASAVAVLPRHIQNRQDGGRLYDHPLFPLIHDQPNEYMPAPNFWEAVMVNLLLYGNGYAFIDKDPDSMRPAALLPLKSACTRPVRYPTGALAYHTMIDGKSFTLPADQVLHVVGMSFDGINGLSPIQYAKQTVGLSLATQKFAAKFFSNGGNVGGILKLPPMNPQAVQAFVESWRAKYAGPENALKTAMLPDGYDFKTTGIDPEKGQMVATRVHQVREIARIYRVPLHMIGDTEKASYASIEMQNQEFYQNTVQPWVNKLEAEASRKLLLEAEKPRLEIKLNMDAMLRGTTRERYATHAQGISAGFLTVNEARRKEGLPPVEGGDTLLRPLNMGPVQGEGAERRLPEATARLLLEDATRRLLTKEQRAIDRANHKHAGKPDELTAWAEQFYAEHRQLVAQAMLATLAAIGSTLTPEQFAADYCEANLELVRRAVAENWPPDELAMKLETRAADVADRLLKGNSDNGQS